MNRELNGRLENDKLVRKVTSVNNASHPSGQRRQHWGPLIAKAMHYWGAAYDGMVG